MANSSITFTITASRYRSSILPSFDWSGAKRIAYFRSTTETRFVGSRFGTFGSIFFGRSSVRSLLPVGIRRRFGRIRVETRRANGLASELFRVLHLSRASRRSDLFPQRRTSLLRQASRRAVEAALRRLRWGEWRIWRVYCWFYFGKIEEVLVRINGFLSKMAFPRGNVAGMRNGNWGRGKHVFSMRAKGKVHWWMGREKIYRGGWCYF